MTREPAPAHVIAAAEQDYQAMRQTLAAFIPTVRALLAELPTEVEAVTEVWLTLVSQDRRAAAMLGATAIVQLARTSNRAGADVGVVRRAPTGHGADDEHQPARAGRPNQPEETRLGAYRKGQRVKVAVTTIQRSSGAAWKDEQGEIVAESGDGYTVRFTSGFVADRVKDNEIQQT